MTPSLWGYRTPCTEPTCSHTVPYGGGFCCQPFHLRTQEWTRTEAARLLSAQVGEPRCWTECRNGLFWSGGRAEVPSAAVCRMAPGGWYNGCYYGGSETVARTSMPGFSPIMDGPFEYDVHAYVQWPGSPGWSITDIGCPISVVCRPMRSRYHTRVVHTADPLHLGM